MEQNNNYITGLAEKLLTFAFIIFMCVSACGHVCMNTGAQGGQRHQIPWSWSYRRLGAVKHGCWDWELGTGNWERAPPEERKSL